MNAREFTRFVLVLLFFVAGGAALDAAQPATITLQIAVPGGTFPDGMEGEPYPE